jgi:hypothetical protein
MDNHLPNGAVLPFGLMSAGTESAMAGFNKTYRNTALRMGIVVKSYDVSNASNLTKLTTEYDILVFEQMEDQGSTILTYRNCIAADGMGAIADYFERTLRVRQNSPNVNSKSLINTSGQNGAVVLILCLDGVTEKAIVVGAVTHPDRPTNLAGKTAFLEGEFNGCNVQVVQDGSATFTFKGATDNYGNPIDASQGNTIVQIMTDGSFQVQHKTITFTLAKSGNVTVTATGDINVTASGKAVVDAPEIDLGAGAAEAVIKGNTFKSMVFDTHIHGTPIGPTSPPTQPMSPSSLSQIVKTK